VVCGVVVIGAAALTVTAIILNQNDHAADNEATASSTTTTGTTAGETTESEDPDCDTGQQSIPQNAQDALDKIDEGKWPPPGTKGGGKFSNDGRGGGEVLPPTDADGNPISYKEWDVNPAGPNGRDAERIVTGSDGSAWYTNDHYGTFTRMK
jgi:guanyl-specific ribonuclease Sa